jgi:hypothetical protein
MITPDIHGYDDGIASAAWSYSEEQVLGDWLP